MASERVQRRIDHLLDQTEEAVDQLNWERVHQLAEAVDLDPDNKDAGQFIVAAERNLSRTGSAGATVVLQGTEGARRLHSLWPTRWLPHWLALRVQPGPGPGRGLGQPYGRGSACRPIHI